MNLWAIFRRFVSPDWKETSLVLVGTVYDGNREKSIRKITCQPDILTHRVLEANGNGNPLRNYGTLANK